MEQVTLDELRELAELARPMLELQAQQAGHDTIKLYLHWTAGWYDQFFDDYHIQIDGDGLVYITTDDLSETLNHTWGRNTGGIGIALCCAAGADTVDLGEAPPTEEQIESMAKVVAVLCRAFSLQISRFNVMTHGEAADNEDDDYHDECDLYGPKNGCERWDLEYLGTAESPIYNPWSISGSRGGDVIRAKAEGYSQQGY